MTTTEALDRLSAEIPNRSFHADKITSHARNYGRIIKYKIAVIPGFNGEESSHFSSPDGFDKPVADCLALAKSVAATENNE